MISNIAPPPGAPPRIIHSFSSLNYFSQCQHRYNEVKILKRFKDAPFAASIEGTDAHKAFEDHIKDGVPLPDWCAKHAPVLEVVAEMRGTKYVELKMAVDVQGNACSYWDKNAAIRGAADLVVIDGTHASVGDWKFGKVKTDVAQLDVMALMVFKRFPQVETISGVLVFVNYDQTVTARYTADQTIPLWQTWVGKMSRVAKAIRETDFPMNPSGLCRGWCPVESCIHYEPKN
jgi:hypothetical protein